MEVEVDPMRVHWREDQYPDYIRLEAMVPDNSGHLVKQSLWTSESRIQVLFDKKS